MVLWSLLVLADAGKTVLELSRQLETCDKQDRPISPEGTTRLVYASSTTNPESGDPVYHTTRGTRSVRLGSPGQDSFNPPEKDVNSFEIQFDPYEVPFDSSLGKKTSYYCKTFRLPEMGTNTHVIRMEPVIPQKNVGLVHHMLIYACYNVDPSFNYTGHCYEASTPPEVSQCNGQYVFGAWAIGSVGITFPDHVGYPLGGQKDVKYVLMEIHYNNEKEVNFTDSSGMRFYYTRKLRKYDAGVWTAGHVTDPLISIPPQQPKVVFDAWCPSQCTQNFPAEGIHFFGSVLHSHVLGRKISLRHVRNGIELPPILHDDTYDFNFQDFEELAKEVTVLPGDNFYIVCEYDTTGIQEPTRFGLSTHEEMCLTYSFYYPKIDNGGCAYGNYSTVEDPDIRKHGPSVFCNGQNYDNLSFSFEPLVPPECVYIGPDENRTTPIAGDFKRFNASKYENRIYLDAEQKFKFHWSLDRNASELRYAVEAETDGWIGIGFSPNGGMVNSDVSMGWIDSKGVVHHKDRFATKQNLPVEDMLQDYYDVRILRASTEPPASTSFWNLTNILLVAAAAFVSLGGIACVCNQWRKRDETTFQALAEN